MIRYMYTNGGTEVEILFLKIIWSVSKLHSSIRSSNQFGTQTPDTGTVHKVLRGVVHQGYSGLKEFLGTDWRRVIGVPTYSNIFLHPFVEMHILARKTWLRFNGR